MIKYYIPILGVYLADKQDKAFLGWIILVNIAYGMFAGFLYWFLNLPIFQS